MSEPTMREPMMLKIREFFRHLTGRAAAPAEPVPAPSR